MPFGWLVLSLLTTFALLAAIGVALRAGPSGRAELWMVSGLVFFALLATPVLTLGYTHQLYRGRLALLSVVLSGGALLFSARSVGLRAQVGRIVRGLGSLATLPYVGLRDAFRARSFVAVGLSATAAMILYAWCLAYLTPGEGWDALFYHEPIVGFAIQNHGFSVVDLPLRPMTQQINGFPRACQSISLWFVVFTDRTFIEAGNLLSAPCVVVAAFALARRYGERVTSMAWGALPVLIPAMWVQIDTAQIDIEVTFFNVAALYYVSRPDYRVRDAMVATLALCLLVASKGTGLTLLPPLALVAYVRLLFHHVRRRPAATFAVAGLGSLSILGTAAAWTVHNAVHFHNPVWPVSFDAKLLHVHLKGLIGLAEMNPSPSFKDLVAKLYDVPVAGFDDLNPRNYGYAVTWVVFPLAIVAFFFLFFAVVRELLFFRRLGLEWNLFVVSLLGIVAIVTSSAWTNARFNMQAIVTCMALVGWLGSRRGWRRLGDGVATAALFLALIPFFWMNGWFSGITFTQAKALTHMPRRERFWMNPDPQNMPFATVRAVDQELGAGDRVAFTSDETWLANLWNSHFSNVLEYVRFENAPQFLELVQGDKWVVVGKTSDARKALDSKPLEWQLVGDATPHDSTVAYRRR
jgi:hypothetical protein